MNVREEIHKFASEEHKPILLWLLTNYSSERKFNFLARCKFERYGVYSFQVARVWEPTREGLAVYQVLS